MSRIRTTSQTWKNIVFGGNFTLETKAVIGAKEYTAISAPVIDQTLMSSPLSVGNVNSATCEVSILTEDTIPAGAEVEIQGRVKEGDQTSEWLSFGTFFINQRDTSYDGLVTINCYDALLKASRGYITTVGDSDPDSWPRPMADVVNVIAQQIGVELDERTQINTGSDYVVSHPGTLTMAGILGYIGACHGGNWIITPENKLRLVPLAGYSENSAITAQAVLGQLSTGPALTVSAIRAEDGDRNSFTAGNTSGATIDLGQNPYVTQQICDDLLQKYSGLVYAPFDATKVIYDPAAELGDSIKIGSAVPGVILRGRMTLDLVCTSNISAPNSEELTEEYPYLSQSKKLQEVAERLDQAVQDAADMAAEAAESLLVDYVKTDYLEANYVKVGTLEAEIGHFEDLLAEYASIDYLEANYAKIGDLEAITGDFEHLLADYATIDYLEANYISAENISSSNIDTGTLNTTLANIVSLLAGDAGIGDLQAINLSSANVNIADATITDAMIAGLTASKITAGTIYTNQVTIQSGESDDSLWISGSVIQMSDKNRVRVQIGKDAEGTYNFYIWDSGGNLMWNALGVTGSGLNDGIIVDKNVADNAAIKGSKLDIKSVASSLMEDGTLVIDASRVTIDDKTLSAVYTTITQSVTALQNNVSTLTTSLDVVQGQISSKVWVSDIETATDELGNEIATLTDQYSDVVQTQNGISAKVAALETTDSSHSAQIAELQVTVDGFSSTVSSAIAEALEEYATQSYVASQIQQSANSIYLAVQEGYAAKASLALVLDQGTGVARLSASADRIEFSSGELVIKSGGLTLDADGNAVFKGQITSSAGSIGGWTINSSSISKTVTLSSGGEYTVTLYGNGQDKVIEIGESGQDPQYILYSDGRSESMTQTVAKEMICSPLQSDWESSSPDSPFFMRCQYKGSYTVNSMALRLLSLDYDTYSTFATFTPNTDSGYNINLGRSNLPFNSVYFCNLSLYTKHLNGFQWTGEEKLLASDAGIRMYYNNAVDRNNNPLVFSLWRDQSGYAPGTMSIYNVSNQSDPFISFRVDPEENELSLYNYVNRSRYVILDGTTGNANFHGAVTCSNVIQTSDRRLKKNINILDAAQCIAFIKSLEPVKFEFADENDDKIHAGFVAQDVAEAQEELGVSFAEERGIPKNDPDIPQPLANSDALQTEWTINYSSIIAPLVSVVQSQQVEIDDLKQKVSALLSA